MIGDLAWDDYDEMQLRRTGTYRLPDDVQHRIEIRYEKIERADQTEHWFWKLDNEAALVTPLAVTEGGSDKSAEAALKAAIELCDKSYKTRDSAREQLQDLEDY